MKKHPLALSAILLAALCSTAPAQTIPDALPVVRDLPRLPGNAFIALRHSDDVASIDVEKNDETQRAAVARMFAPFDTLAIGGTTVRLDTERSQENNPSTRLSDLARLWGNTRAHGEGEILFRAACWDSRPAGLRVIMTSSLDQEQHINGWVVSRDTTPSGQTCGATDKLTPPTMPHGLQLGADRAAVLRALPLPPTKEQPAVISWAYTVMMPDDSAVDYMLDVWFTNGKLSDVHYQTLVTF